MEQKINKILRIILMILAVAGMVIMGYLVSLHYAGGDGSACDLGEGLSCSAVNTSKYSSVLGIPVSMLGLLYFAGVLIISLFRYTAKSLKNILFTSIAFLMPSLYLTAIEIFVIKNICIFCEISKILIVTIIVLTSIALRPKKLTMQKVVYAILFGLILSGLMYVIQIGGRTTKNYETFSQCLYDSGLRMYGSATCSFCAKQRALFGDAFENIKEIECDPRNPNPQTELCIARDIAHTPTWILEDENGDDVFRFEAGVQSLETLSEVSGCPLTEDTLTDDEL